MTSSAHWIRQPGALPSRAARRSIVAALTGNVKIDVIRSVHAIAPTLGGAYTDARTARHMAVTHTDTKDQS